MSERDLFRLHNEPCMYYSEMQIHRALMINLHPFMNMLERFYFAWQADNKIVNLPRKQVFTTEGLKGDFRVMPCVINNFEEKIIKAVKIIGTNEEEKHIKDKNAVGKALLIDATDNFVKGIFDVCALSSFRTAAISALAFKHTVGSTQQQVGLIGTGRIGSYMAVILSRWLQVGELYVHDINQKRLDQFKEIFSRKIKINDMSFNEICNSCTAVFLSTTSTSPLLKENNAKNIQFISSVGADADNLSELHESLLKNRQVISESRQNISFGDLRRWHEAGLIKEAQVTELRDIMGSLKKQKQPVLFISTGTAIQDALICQFLFEQFNKKKPSILFYPEHPRGKPYPYSIIQICNILGYEMSINPEDKFDLIMRWEDKTYAQIDQQLEDLAMTNKVINLKCLDISKRHIDQIFYEVFGYNSLIDPSTYEGECVEKSNLNGRHDGQVVQCPLKETREDSVYQKLINNRYDDEFVVDMRVLVFNKTIPFVYFKYKPLNDRFSLSVKGTKEELKNVLNTEEIDKILQFCERLGFDCGELDILRDQTDNRIYIVDANNTPTLHFAGFTDQQKRDSLRHMSVAFSEAFAATR